MKTFLIFITLFFSLSAKAQSYPAGTSTAIWGKPTYTQLAQAKEKGVSYIEVAMNPYYRNTSFEDITPMITQLKERVDSASIKVWSVHLPFSKELDISVIDSAKRARNVQIIKDIIDITSTLNPQCYVIHPSSEPIEDTQRDIRKRNAVESLKEIQYFIKDLNVVLCVENLPRTCLGNTPEELVQIVKAVDGVKVCFDTNHYVDTNHHYSTAVSYFMSIAGDYVATIHASDYDFENECHWLPTRGRIDWTAFIRDLAAHKYRGVFMYEATKFDKQNNRSLTIEDIIWSYNEIFNK